MENHFAPFLNGSKSQFVLAENERFMAVLEENPLASGHSVVFPKRVEDFVFDLSDDELSGLMLFSKKIAHAIQKVVPCKKVGVAVIGLQVRHAHVHLVPIQSADDLNFTKSKLTVDVHELLSMVTLIRTVL